MTTDLIIDFADGFQLTIVMKACSEKGVRWDAQVNQECSSVVVEIKHPSRTKKVDGEMVLRSENEYEAA